MFSAIVAFSFKKSIDDGFDLIEQAFKVDPKCENAYECMVKFCLFTYAILIIFK